jgi:hypothetical protein
LLQQNIKHRQLQHGKGSLSAKGIDLQVFLGAALRERSVLLV